MTLDQAIERYGPITNGIWPNETLFCSILKIPPDISQYWLNTAAGSQTTHIYCNKDLQEPLLIALQNVRDRGLLTALHTFDGCLNIREVRGEPEKISSHAYGISIDINAASNKLGETGDIPPQLVECFTSTGFNWGGRFHRKDPMHFSLGDW